VSDVFAAFADLTRRRQWLRLGTLEHELDFRVGGVERAAGMIGPEHVVYAARFLDIVAPERIVVATTLTVDGRPRTASLVTVELSADGPAASAVRYTEQYAILGPAEEHAVDAAHLEGSLPLLLNALMLAVEPDRPAQAVNNIEVRHT
jgi:uncharacterized protein YndB with AHSA1/START domain